MSVLLGYQLGIRVRVCVYVCVCVCVKAAVCPTGWCIEHRSHLSDCLQPLSEVLFEARVNLRQPETSKIRLETEKALLAVSDNSDPAVCKQTRPSL